MYRKKNCYIDMNNFNENAEFKDNAIYASKKGRLLTLTWPF